MLNVTGGKMERERLEKEVPHADSVCAGMPDPGHDPCAGGRWRSRLRSLTLTGAAASTLPSSCGCSASPRGRLDPDPKSKLDPETDPIVKELLPANVQEGMVDARAQIREQHQPRSPPAQPPISEADPIHQLADNLRKPPS